MLPSYENIGKAKPCEGRAVENLIATIVATSRHVQSIVNDVAAGVATGDKKESFVCRSSGDSGDYIVHNILEVATGGDCGGDHVCEEAGPRSHIIYMPLSALPRQVAAGARIPGQHARWALS